MKSLIILTLVLSAVVSHGAIYRCKLEYRNQQNNRNIQFEFDTIKEDNHWVPVDENQYVGCNVLRGTGPLVTCGLGGDGKPMIFATAHEGSTIGLDFTHRSDKMTLICVNKNN